MQFNNLNQKFSKENIYNHHTIDISNQKEVTINSNFSSCSKYSQTLLLHAINIFQIPRGFTLNYNSFSHTKETFQFISNTSHMHTSHIITQSSIQYKNSIQY